MEKEMKEWQRIIHGLVWRYRNIGYRDSIYGPVMPTGNQRAEQRLEAVEKKRKVKLSPKNFEDLVGEGNLILAQVLQEHKMGLVEDVAATLHDRLRNHFLNLHKRVQRHGLTSSLEDESYEEIPAEETPFTRIADRWEEKLKDAKLPYYLKKVAEAVIQQDQRLLQHMRDSRLNRTAIKRFCTNELGSTDTQAREVIRIFDKIGG